ncbi:glycosyltransferase [Pseudoxanthobacter sp. M-2]|uniref:glycosyltransferase n=1 Tax=Pseudoxanthobacter sp. M-2 TaxID=3078754 RepID=UPI0038FC5546
MRRTRQSGAVGAAAIEAVAALADADYVSRRWPGFEAGFDAPHLAERLRGLTVAEAPPINPLLDWGHLARLAGADGAETALAVLADYAGRGLPAGLSPHPLLRERIVRRRAAGTLAGDGAWVRAAFAAADEEGRTFLPVLDPAFVLTTLGVAPDALAGWGFRSVGRFYLAEAVRRGVPPCAVFDPVFVLAATGRSVETGAAPPVVLAAALAAYLDAIERGEAPSPSAVFDEAFVWTTQPAVAAALANGAGSALEAWLALGSPPVARTASGLEAFPEAMPQPWWERERRAATLRGRKRLTPARLIAEAVERVRTADPPTLAVRVTPQMPEAVFAGEAVTLFADGFACSPGGVVATVALCLGDDEVAREVFQALPRAEAFARSTDVVDATAQLFGGFALAWTGPAPTIGRHAVTLRVGVAGPGGGEALTRTVALGTFEVRRRPVARRAPATKPAPIIAIAMATFEPNGELFAAQLESIRAQTMRDWRLVVSDESETVAARDLVERLTRTDPRISVRHGPRLGVVGNFERALRAGDQRASFVALADQDDRWHPDKLERMLARMTEGVALVHGAMRLVDAGGRALPGVAETRRLPGPSLADLLAENEVTGASTLMRMSVVDAALPLPRLPGLFHDHWLALVARVQGRVVFEPSVVQDYVQHGGNVVGEDPRRDRTAAARLGREREAFRRLMEQRLAGEGGVPAGVAERALLPAAFAVVPAAVMRLAAWDALMPRLPAEWPMGLAHGFGLPGLRAPAAGRSAEVSPSREAGRLTKTRLAAFAKALAAAADEEGGGNGNVGAPARLGVASWLADGLAALEAMAGRPALVTAIAAIHHRRAAAKTR